MPEDAPVIVFDGVCVLCSRWVDFILRHDVDGRFKLAAMQGAHGRSLLTEHGLSPDDPSSLLLVQGGRGYIDTDAVIRVLRSLGSGWRLTGNLLKCVPRPIRDALYRWLARNRYALFGKRSRCRLPDPAQTWRFLD
jgi:predicted DCC family thiol-disulfide oxidoreductase YuxK